jgi:hypothetical protein
MRTEEQELLSPSGPGFLDRVIALALRNKALVIIGLVLLVAMGLRAASPTCRSRCSRTPRGSHPWRSSAS